MSAENGDASSTESSVCNAYCVVYKLENADWKVTGEGWSQVDGFCDDISDEHGLGTSVQRFC